MRNFSQISAGSRTNPGGYSEGEHAMTRHFREVAVIPLPDPRWIEIRYRCHEMFNDIGGQIIGASKAETTLAGLANCGSVSGYYVCVHEKLV